jgi:uncharacterized protein YceK
MRVFVLLAVSSTMLLSGCAGAIMAHATRKESNVAVAKVMAAERPEIDSAGAAACVQKAMTIVEIAKLGTADNFKSVSAENRARVLTYAARPEAAQCIAALPVKAPA